MVEIQQNNDTVVVRLNGAFGQPEADILDLKLPPLADQKPRVVVFDLSGVTLMASVALGTILALNRAVRKNGGKVRLAAPGRNVLGALRFTRIDDILEICASVDAAVGT
ncbi:MAG: STAS domain-containing protein [Tepidisphaeraceae bacterium]